MSKEIAQALGLGVQYGAPLPYLRANELEADRLGLGYMAKAGYDPAEALAFWQTFVAKTAKGSPPTFLSTHPAGADRIAQLGSCCRKPRRSIDRARANEGLCQNAVTASRPSPPRAKGGVLGQPRLAAAQRLEQGRARPPRGPYGFKRLHAGFAIWTSAPRRKPQQPQRQPSPLFGHPHMRQATQVGQGVRRGSRHRRRLESTQAASMRDRLMRSPGAKSVMRSTAPPGCARGEAKHIFPALPFRLSLAPRPGAGDAHCRRRSGAQPAHRQAQG